jgi:hypothetical protein
MRSCVVHSTVSLAEQPVSASVRSRTRRGDRRGQTEPGETSEPDRRILGGNSPLGGQDRFPTRLLSGIPVVSRRPRCRCHPRWPSNARPPTWRNRRHCDDEPGSFESFPWNQRPDLGQDSASIMRSRETNPAAELERNSTLLPSTIRRERSLRYVPVFPRW